MSSSRRDHQPALADAQVQNLLQPGHSRAGGTAAAAQLQRPGSADVARPPAYRLVLLVEGRPHHLGLAQVLHRGEGVVDRVPGRLQGDHRRSEDPAGPAGVGAPREPGVAGELLEPVGRRVQPGAEGAEPAGVARDVAVHAVQDERELQQHRAGDQGRRPADGEQRGRAQPDHHRGHRDLVRREP